MTAHIKLQEVDGPRFYLVKNMYLTIIKLIAKYQEADLFKNGHMVFLGMIIELLRFLHDT